jgi:hypothetical protein
MPKDEIGIPVTTLFRDYLVREGIEYKRALEIAEEFNKQIEEVDWLSTYTGVTFTCSFRPNANK